MKMKKIMKKISVMVLGLTMAAALTACSNATSNKQTDNTVGTENGTGTENNTGTENTADDEVVLYTDTNVVGGWENNQGSVKPEDNEAAQAAFEKATELLVGYEYEVIAYLGSQIVQGTNYAYLCKGTPVVLDAESEYCLLNVYEDLEGNAEITGMEQLLDVGSEDMMGGWSYNQGEAAMEDNEDISSAFDRALEGLVGVSYEPLFFLGSQVVAGSNYAVFCSKAPVVPDAEKSFCIAYIYEDLEGNASLTEVADVDLTAESESTDETDSAGAIGGVQIANPFMEVATLAEAGAVTGFELNVPAAPAEYPDMTIQVMNQSMIEVIFTNKANETEAGQDEGYRIRKASGSEDISGDYNEYANVYTETINGCEVTLKGNDENVSVAVWSVDGYAYSVTAETHPLSHEVMTEVINSVK